MPEALLLLNTAATLFMVGLIWFVQIVHYPLHGLVGPAEFVRYQRQHTRRTGWVVGPPMIVEIITAPLLTVFTPPRVAPALPWLGLALLACVWASTLLHQIPCHRRLERSWSDRDHRRLVTTNWIRTVAWTGRGLICVLMIGQSLTT